MFHKYIVYLTSPILNNPNTKFCTLKLCNSKLNIFKSQINPLKKTRTKKKTYINNTIVTHKKYKHTVSNLGVFPMQWLLTKAPLGCFPTQWLLTTVSHLNVFPPNDFQQRHLIWVFSQPMTSDKLISFRYFPIQWLTTKTSHLGVFLPMTTDKGVSHGFFPLQGLKQKICIQQMF